MKLNKNQRYVGESRGVIYIENILNNTVSKYTLISTGELCGLIEPRTTQYVATFRNTPDGIASYKKLITTISGQFVKMGRRIGGGMHADGKRSGTGNSSMKYATHFDVYDRTRNP